MLPRISFGFFRPFLSERQKGTKKRVRASSHAIPFANGMADHLAPSVPRDVFATFLKKWKEETQD